MKYLIMIVLIVLMSGCSEMKADPTRYWDEVCYKGYIFIKMSWNSSYGITNLLDEHGMPVPCDRKTFCDKINEMEMED